MDSNRIVKAGMNAAKTADMRWLVIDLLFAVADGAMTRWEAERDLIGLVDDPAALLEKVGQKGETL